MFPTTKWSPAGESQQHVCNRYQSGLRPSGRRRWPSRGVAILRADSINKRANHVEKMSVEALAGMSLAAVIVAAPAIAAAQSSLRPSANANFVKSMVSGHRG
jgi:hypothetical protein